MDIFSRILTATNAPVCEKLRGCSTIPSGHMLTLFFGDPPAEMLSPKYLELSHYQRQISDAWAYEGDLNIEVDGVRQAFITFCFQWFAKWISVKEMPEDMFHDGVDQGCASP